MAAFRASVLICAGAFICPVAAENATASEAAIDLFTDFAPLLALFGDQFATQFMRETLIWPDHVIFAMAPLGILTAVIGAIRVGGPSWARAVVGRARETRAAAELELMSSTSHEVCELFNGRYIVRSLGKPSLEQFLYLWRGSGEDARREIYTMESAVREGLVKSRRLAGPLVLARNDPQDEETARTDAKHNSDPDSDGTYNDSAAPNVVLNLSDYSREAAQQGWKLLSIAIVSTIIQAAVLAISALSVYNEDLASRVGEPSAPYGFPLFVSGTISLVVGMMLCSWTIERSTSERLWYRVSSPSNDAQASGTKDSDKIGIVWLQRDQRVSDQKFAAFAIHGGWKESIITSTRRDAQTSADPRQGAAYNYLLALSGAFLGLVGFIIQFQGLRGLTWPSSVAQLIAIAIMAVLRAFVRRKIGNKPPAHQMHEGHELDWLACNLVLNEEHCFTPQTGAGQQDGGDNRPATPGEKGTDGKPEPRVAHKRLCWRVVTANSSPEKDGCFVSPGQFSSSRAKKAPTGDDSSPHNRIWRLRQRLGVSTRWTGPASADAVTLARSIEAVMNHFFPNPSQIVPAVERPKSSTASASTRESAASPYDSRQSSASETNSAISVADRTRMTRRDTGKSTLTTDSGTPEESTSSESDDSSSSGPSPSKSSTNSENYVSAISSGRSGPSWSSELDPGSSSEGSSSIWTWSHRSRDRRLSRVATDVHRGPSEELHDIFRWSLDTEVVRDSTPVRGTADFTIRYNDTSKSWEADSTELEAALSLWMSSLEQISYHSEADVPQDDWLRQQKKSDVSVRRILGRDATSALHRDMTWWMGSQPVEKLREMGRDLAPDGEQASGRSSVAGCVANLEKTLAIGWHGPPKSDASQAVPAEAIATTAVRTPAVPSQATPTQPEIPTREVSTLVTPAKAAPVEAVPVQVVSKAVGATSTEEQHVPEVTQLPSIVESEPSVRPNEERRLTPMFHPALFADQVTAPRAKALSQHIFSGFLWAIAAEVPESSLQPAQQLGGISVLDPFEDSMSRVSPKIQSQGMTELTQRIEQAGIFSLQEAFVSVIPPLSWYQKLPSKDVVDYVRTTLTNLFELGGQWNMPADVYCELLRTCFLCRPCQYCATAVVACIEFIYLVSEPLKHEAKTGNCAIPLAESGRLKRELRHLLESTDFGQDSDFVAELRWLYSAQNRKHVLDAVYETTAPEKERHPAFKASSRKTWGLTEFHLVLMDHHSYDLENMESIGAAQSLFENLPDVFGWGALHYNAARSNNLKLDLTLPRTLAQTDIVGKTFVHYWMHAQCFEPAKERPALTALRQASQARSRDGMQLLHMAADFGSHDITKFLLDHMVESTDAQDIWGRTPLHFAAAGGVVSVVGLLTDASANVNIRCRPELRAWTPLHMAVAHNRRRVIPMVAGDGMDWAMWEDSLDMTPIEVAADVDAPGCVEELVKLWTTRSDPSTSTDSGEHPSQQTDESLVERRQGVDKDDAGESESDKPDDMAPGVAGETDLFKMHHWRRAVQLAARKGHTKSVSKMLELSEGSCRTQVWKHAFRHSVAGGKSKTVSYLLRLDGCSSEAAGDEIERGRPLVPPLISAETVAELLDADMRSPCPALELALSHRREDTARALLSEPHIAGTMSRERDIRIRIMATAAKYGLKDMVALLLINHPEIVDAEDGKGRRPLSNAAERADAETVKFLLAQEAVDINARDDAGRTALSYAAGKGKLSIARLLLAQDGIDANVADEERRTALMYAAVKGYKEIARLLLDHPGVDIDAEDDKGRTALDWASIGKRRGTMDLIRQKKPSRLDPRRPWSPGWRARRRTMVIEESAASSDDGEEASTPDDGED